MRRAHRTGAVALAIALWACGAPAEPVEIEIAAIAEDGIEGAAPIAEPAAIAIDRRGPGRYRVVIDRRRAPITLRAEGACPIVLDRDALDSSRASAERFVRMRPLFEIRGERTQIGYGARFEISLVPACPEAERAAIEWRSLASIAELAIGDRGRIVRGRMPTLEEAGVRIPPSGVIAISPRTRGTRVLYAEIVSDGIRSRLAIELHAAARASGIPSVAMAAHTYLAGEDLTIAEAPPRAHASLEQVAPGVSVLRVDARGRYLVRDASGSTFSIAAGDHTATDLDCGRPECHPAAAEHARASPMTTVFSRLLDDERHELRCAIACHAVGEPGLEDGGIVAVARSLAPLPARGGPGAYDRLPRELRRLASVGCTSCHGPGAIPEPGARDRIVRTDLCAVCHDAPPRYPQVAAWRSTRMGAPDRDPRLSPPECARCHDTAAYLGIALPSPPHEIEIGCAACHAPHAEQTGPHLTRRPTLREGVPETLAASSSRLCASCHAPDPTFDLPTASAVALTSGAFVFGIDPARAPHRALQCTSCHGRDGELHAFRAGACTGCHEDRPEPADLRARIEALASRVGGALGRADARPIGAPIDDRGRARWNAALLAGDRAAWAHAGTLALEMLHEAEAPRSRETEEN